MPHLFSSSRDYQPFSLCPQHWFLSVSTSTSVRTGISAIPGTHAIHHSSSESCDVWDCFRKLLGYCIASVYNIFFWNRDTLLPISWVWKSCLQRKLRILFWLLLRNKDSILEQCCKGRIFKLNHMTIWLHPMSAPRYGNHTSTFLSVSVCENLHWSYWCPNNDMRRNPL